MPNSSNSKKLSAKLWLAWTLAVRGYSQRYKGSFLGYLWPFVSMFALLLLYSMVFSIIFQAKWKQMGVDAPVAEAPFWIILLAGQLVYTLMAEVLNQSPNIVLAVPNYVKKIKFPLEILPMVSFIGSLFNALISLLVLVAVAAALGIHHWTALLAPVVFIQMALWCLGLGWLLSSLGVLFRDLQQIMPLIAQILLFATPIFYSPQLVPPEYQIVLAINPLAYMVETLRGLVLWGQLPNWGIFALWTLGGGLFALFGLSVFQRLRHTFADIM